MNVKIPQNFYDDHVGRDLPGGAIVSTLKRHYVVELNESEFDELLSDADYYADEAVRQMGSEFIGLASSARATARAMRKQREEQHDALAVEQRRSDDPLGTYFDRHDLVEQARSRQCPVCFAAAGEQCVDRWGLKTSLVHDARHDAPGVDPYAMNDPIDRSDCPDL